MGVQVHDHEVDSSVLEDLESGVFESRQIVLRNAVNHDVQPTALKLEHLGGEVRNHANVHRGETCGGYGILAPVVVETGELVLTGLEATDVVGPRAGRVRRQPGLGEVVADRIGLDRFRTDDARPVRRSHVVDECAVGLVQGDDQRVVVWRLVARHIKEHVCRPCIDAHPALEARDDVLRGQIGAIVELDTLTNLERVHQPVVADVITLSQQRFDFGQARVRLVAEQALVGAAGDVEPVGLIEDRWIGHLHVEWERHLELPAVRHCFAVSGTRGRGRSGGRGRVAVRGRGRSSCRRRVAVTVATGRSN